MKYEEVEEIPYMVSFSGGRSSAMMTKILHDNLINEKLIVCFANTGKEDEGTLKFVHDFETNFGIDVTWIEYDNNDYGFRVVSYESASRKGEPYQKLISKRRFVPNAVTRYCTTELKIRPIKRFMQQCGYKYWYNAIGIRYDEPNRYRRLPLACQKEPYESIAPLYDFKITKQDVLNFWATQNFDLSIPEYMGNCDMCFLKSRFKLKKIIKEQPNRVGWWKEMEEKTGATFRNGISYAMIEKMVAMQPELFDDENEIDCFCTID